jgi:hypothetical protein
MTDNCFVLAFCQPLLNDRLTRRRLERTTVCHHDFAAAGRVQRRVRPGYHCPDADSNTDASPRERANHWNPPARSANGWTNSATLSQVPGVNPHSKSDGPTRATA